MLSVTAGGTAAFNIADGAGTISVVVDGTGPSSVLVVDPASPNAYSGGTTVPDGTLIAASDYSVPANTSLTIGAGGTFIFDPTYFVNNPGGGDDDSASPGSPAMTLPTTPSVPLAVQSIACVGPATTSTRRCSST